MKQSFMVGCSSWHKLSIIMPEFRGPILIVIGIIIIITIIVIISIIIRVMPVQSNMQ